MTTDASQAPNLQEIHDCFLELAKKAGEMITGAKPLINAAESKKNSSDLVTETDRAVEQMVSTALKGKYPDYKFMGEETYQPGSRLTNAPTFIVDPIDGTVNFVHGFPNTCISLGFAINKKPVVGVVFNPFTNALYSAIRGQGAFLNQKTRLPLKGDTVEPLSGLSNALVGVEWGSDRSGQNWDTKIRTFENLGKTREQGGAMVHSMRSMGSAALNLCAVAAGYMDLYWEGGCWAWDVCAGWVILTEAGGIMVDGNPGGWEAEVDGRQYLAVRASKNREGQKAIVEEFWSHIKGRFSYGH
ncbi:inositol monophosphatase family protein [Emydomyces testavorans]|uniref:Inositol-1-monophosphatase n=1 Tax=Emydomyces testavorans TaxID=2070801 RepID=A0AAF0DME6_9EURO|nr:inositol monophosphatase family protein [Emydomyces testavorans]